MTTQLSGTARGIRNFVPIILTWRTSLAKSAVVARDFVKDRRGKSAGDEKKSVSASAEKRQREHKENVAGQKATKEAAADPGRTPLAVVAKGTALEVAAEDMADTIIAAEAATTNDEVGDFYQCLECTGTLASLF